MAERSTTPWLTRVNSFTDRPTLLQSVDPQRAYRFDVSFEITSPVGVVTPVTFTEEREKLRKSVVSFRDYSFSPEKLLNKNQTGQTWVTLIPPTEKSFTIEFEELPTYNGANVFSILTLIMYKGLSSLLSNQSLLGMVDEEFIQNIPEKIDKIIVDKLDGQGFINETMVFFNCKILELKPGDLAYETNATARTIATFNFESYTHTFDSTQTFEDKKKEHEQQGLEVVPPDSHSIPKNNFDISDDINSGETFKPSSIRNDDPDPAKFYPYNILDVGEEGVLDTTQQFKPKPNANTWQAKV